MYAKTSPAAASLWLVFAVYLTPLYGSAPYNEKLMEALAKRVGKSYTVRASEEREPRFLLSPSPSAPSFRAGAKESFEITALVRGSNQEPYYKLRFASGKEGFLSFDSFMKEFNSTILAQTDEKREKTTKEKEANRQAWIRSQPWPTHVKEAALKGQAVLGMNKSEARTVLGRPTRVIQLTHDSALLGSREQWLYESGLVLTFTNGAISRIDAMTKRE